MTEQIYELTFWEVIFWLFTVAVVFTLYGMKMNFQRVVEMTIDNLIDNGFLKTRKNKEGEIEILKHNEE